MRYGISVLLLFFVFSALFITGAVADVTLTATVDKPVIRVGESTLMKVVVQSTNAQSGQNPSIPNTEGLTISSRGAPSQQFSMTSINGQVQQSYTRTYTFDVIGILPGSYSLDAIQLSTPEGTTTAEPLAITVLEADEQPPQQGTSATTVPQSNPYGIYLLADITQNEAYVGEELILTYFLLVPQELSNRINVSPPQDNPGKFQDFWEENHNLEGNREEQTVRLQNNKLYRKYTLFRHSLFPYRSGEFEIAPTQIQARVARPVSVLFNQYEEVNIVSNPVSVTVNPLPERGRPESFRGAVGQFQLTTTIDQTEIEEGDPVTLTIRLEGSGNMNNAPAPQLPDFTQFDQFDPTTTEDIRIDRNGVTGRIEYTYILIPHGVHADTIGPVRYSFFDPSKDTYVELSSDPITLSITPGEGLGGTGSGFTTRRMIVRLGDDFRFISTSPLALSSVSITMWQSPLFWLAGGFPIVGMIGAVAWRKKQDHVLNNPKEQRKRQAPARVQAALQEAQTAFSEHDKDRVYLVLGKMIREYLDHRWELTTTGMTRTELDAALDANGYDEVSRMKIHEMLEIVDSKRYSGTASISDIHVKGDLDRAETLVQSLIR